MGQSTLSVRVDDDLLDALDAEAEENNLARSKHVRLILKRRHDHEEYVKEKQQELEEEREKYEQQIAELEAEVDKWKTKYNEREESDLSISEELEQATETIRTAHDEALSAKVGEVRQENRKLRSQVKDLQREINRLESHRDDLQEQLEAERAHAERYDELEQTVEEEMARWEDSVVTAQKGSIAGTVAFPVKAVVADLRTAWQEDLRDLAVFLKWVVYLSVIAALGIGIFYYLVRFLIF